MPHERFRENLLPEEPRPKNGEILKFNDRGEIVDEAGNVYDENGNPIREKTSKYFEEAFRLARKVDPKIEPGDDLVRAYIKELKQLDQKKKVK